MKRIKENSSILYHIYPYVALIAIVFISGCTPYDPGPWDYKHIVSFGRTPKYSPDRSRIAFGGSEADNTGIWLYGGPSGVVQLTDLYHNWDYEWSPDGQRIVFSNPSGGNNSGLWIVDMEGNLEHLSESGRFPSWETIPGMGDTMIVFQEGVGEGINMISTASEEVTVLTGIGESPKVSPDGDFVAFLLRSEGGGSYDSLHLYHINSGTDQTLAACGTNFDWSPDGNTITFERYELYTNGYILNVKIVNVNTGYVSILWTGAKNPRFSPDGNRIVFEAIAGDVADGIFMVAPGGGSVEEVTYSGFGPDVYLNTDRIIYWKSDGIWRADRN